MTPESLRRLADLLEADPMLEVRGVQLVRSAEPRAPMTATERSAKRRAVQRLMQRERAENSTNSTAGVAPKEVPPQTPPPESSHLSISDLAEKEPESGSGLRSGDPEILAESMRARGGATHARTPSVAVASGADDERETVIPLNLLARAEELGVFSDMLAGMPGVEPEQVRDAAREFVSYWTVGAGTGKRRRLWMAKLRESIRKSWREGKLKAPGAIEHSARTGSDLEEPRRKKPDPWAWQWEPGGPYYGKPRPTTGPEADPNRRASNGHR